MNCELMLTYHTPAYMFNVYKNQLSRQTGSRNLKGPKKLPEKYLGTVGRTDRGKTVYPLSGGAGV